MASVEKIGERKKLFLSSLFFVLGFSVVFSAFGVLLQTALAGISKDVAIWLSRVAGVIIIIFGLFLLGLFTPEFLVREHTIKARRFRSLYITSFIFGAAFALGWTPCVGAALGAIFALAATETGNAFFLLFAYTLGIGLPFLLVGLFADQAEGLVRKLGPWLIYIQYVFGVALIMIGILIFTDELNLLANFSLLAEILVHLNLTTSIGGGINSLSLINLLVAFGAGLGSFLSPCILPIVPGFLSYLVSTAVGSNNLEKNDE